MANTLWLLYSEALVLCFVLRPLRTLSVDILLSVDTSSKCSQPVICKHSVNSDTGSIIISPNDPFALGKAVESVDGNIVLLSSVSSCRFNYFRSQITDQTISDFCSVNCSTFFLKQKNVCIQSVHNVTTVRKQPIFDSMTVSTNRNWNSIIKGINGLLATEKWKTHIVFANKYEELTAVSSSIQPLTSKLFLFTIDKASRLNDTLSTLYGQLHKKDLNFILVCSATCIVDFLHQVHEFETLIDKTSDKWLVIPTEGCPHDIANTNVRLTNADIVIMDFAGCSGEFSTFTWNKMSDLLSSSRNSVGLTRNMEEMMEQNRTSAIANVYTVHTSKNDREIRHVGHVNDNGEVDIGEDLYPGFKYGFRQRTLIVSTLPWPPFVFRVRNNGTVSYKGVCIDLLTELSRALNFSYKIVEPEDQEWGRVLDGKWTGLIGQLAYKKIDLVTAPIAILESREKVIDFTVPYFYEKSDVILKLPDPNAKKWMVMLAPFRYEVHICIIFSLAFSAIVLYAVEELHVVNASMETGVVDRLTRFSDIFWYHLGANEGHYYPITQAGRCVLSCWWLFTLISGGIYCGNLIAFLTDWRVEPPFTELSEMVDQGDYSWGIIGGSTYITLFQNSSRPVYKKVWQGLQSDGEATSLDTEVHKRRVLAGGYAFLGEETLMQQWRSESCDLQILNDQFFLMNYAVGLTNNSEYTSLFSNQVLRINEIGLPRVWYKRWSSSLLCGASKSAKRVDLMALQSAFYAAGVGALLAFCVLIYEAINNGICYDCLQATRESGGYKDAIQLKNI